MYDFPAGFYADVRIEDVSETAIGYTFDQIDQARERRYTAAFVRVFDGERWYFAATTDIDDVQSEIRRLAGYATRNPAIAQNPIVARFAVHHDERADFDDSRVDHIPLARKDDLLRSHFAAFSGSCLKRYSPTYLDAFVRKTFVSSLGAQLSWDFQKTGLGISFDLADDGEHHFSEMYQAGADRFEDLPTDPQEAAAYLDRAKRFMTEAESIEPCDLAMILSPRVAGVFAHESFGHKSEADFMVGDETMRREWALGTSVAWEGLSIVDDGNEPGIGYTPFDDEGTPASKTYLIRDGKLAGRLHSCATAADLDEEPTGNARAVNFQFQPIVRMTTTYIEPGTQSKDELIGGVEDGILVEGLNHGSGLSTFTIAPTFAYRIRDGRVAEPVQVSVITGNVFETLGRIDGVSDTLELKSFVRGGCGKSEQFPLPVGFGGPWVRVRLLHAQ